MVPFALRVAGGALVAGRASRSTVLVGHLVLRHPQLRALPDALSATALDHVDLAGVLVRRLPPLHGTAVSCIPVVLSAHGPDLRASSARRVGDGGRRERLIDLVLAIFLRGGHVGLVALAGRAIRRATYRVVEGSHILHLGVLEAHEGTAVSNWLVVFMQPAVGAVRIDSYLLAIHHGQRVVGEHELAAVERAILELLLKKYLLVQHAEHLLVEVVADVLVVDIHLHLLHLVIGGQLGLLGAVLHLPHLSQLVAQSYLVLLDLILQISNMLIVLRMRIAGRILALRTGLKVAHGGDLLLLRLLCELILRIFARESLDQLIRRVTTGQLGASEHAHLVRRRIRCLFANMVLVSYFLQLESWRDCVLEASRTYLRSALVHLLHILLMLSIVVLVMPLLGLTGGSLLHGQLARLAADRHGATWSRPSRARARRLLLRVLRGIISGCRRLRASLPTGSDL